MSDLSLEVPAGEICVLVGPSGCGKTTAMRMVNRMIDITEGDILRRRQERQGPRPRPAAARHRLRDPADRPLPAPDHGRQHRDRARGCSAGTRSASRARVDELLDWCRSTRRDARPLSRPALGRPAPARRRGPRARRGPAADADGRALRRDRPDQPRAASERVPAAPAGDPQDDRLRDPRHRRGDQDGRPDRRAQEGRQAGPVRHARRAADRPGGQLRGGLRRRRPRPQAPRPPARARHRPLEGRRSCAPASRCRTRARRSRTPTSSIPLLVDGDGKPLGWLQRGALQGERVEPGAALARRARWSSSTTCCATPSPTCSQTDTRYGPVVDENGCVAGVLSIEVIGTALQASPRRSRTERMPRWPRMTRAARPDPVPGAQGRRPAWRRTASARTGSSRTSTATSTPSGSTSSCGHPRWRSASASPSCSR